jgi:mannose-6-phosphate isomerase-like protein (cupin superfamily)
MVTSGDIHELPGGASFAIRTSTAESDGDRIELEITLPPGASGPPPHFHPRQEERWEVLEGTLSAQVDGNWRDLAAGESATVPAGHVHTLRNRTSGTVRVLDVHIPALDFEDYMLDLSRLNQEGKITSLRSPRSLVYLASVLRDHRTTQLTASRPQRIAESALAGVGKVLGMRVR